MKRREFITLLGGAAATWPLAVRAQQGDRVRRVGVLMALAADDPQGQARVAALANGLQQLGWTVDRNLRIDTRWAAANAADARKYAAELVALAPEVAVLLISFGVKMFFLSAPTAEAGIAGIRFRGRYSG